MRTTLLDVLDQFASPRRQRSDQQKVPDVCLPEEMACTWLNFYPSDSGSLTSIWSGEELLVLRAFHESFCKANAELPLPWPSLENYITSDQGVALTEAACAALSDLAE